MRQFYLPGLFLAAAILWAIPPASAQLSSGSGSGSGSGGGFGGTPGGGPAPQPRPATPDFAPPALPGAGAPGLNTSQSVAKPITGDPTPALFTAVNNGDYGAAQDAVSRGADLNAQNSLGETPLDLSIALNHNSITFMLLAARNEGDSGPDTSTPTTANVPFHQSGKVKPIRAKLVTPIHVTSPAYSNNPGTPNPAAGFLGFGPGS